MGSSMNSVFSADDFSDSFWSSPGATPPRDPDPLHELPMHRSLSEWALQEFLADTPVVSQSTASRNGTSVVTQPTVLTTEEGFDDDLMEIKTPPYQDQALPGPLDRCANYDDYQAYLKSKLDLACAAVALRGSFVKPEDKPSLTENQRQAQLGSQALVTQQKADVGSLGTTPLPAMQGKSGVQVGQAASGSSREDSDDDEPEGDTENTEGSDPVDDKRARRMLSNRESARRSRRRKQAHLSELEAQTGQLRVDNSSLLKGLTDLKHKCDDAIVDNRILKADIETLRVKVKMAEETMKRLTGVNPMLLAKHDAKFALIDNFMGASTNATLPMQPNPNQFFHQPGPSIATTTPNIHNLDHGIPNNTQVSIENLQNNSGGNNRAETSISQPLVNREHVHQLIHHIVNPSGSGAMSGWDSGLAHASGDLY